MKRFLIVGSTSGIGESLKKIAENQGDRIESFSRSNGVDVREARPEFPELEEKIDGLVYCPGTINLKPFSSLSIEDFQNDLDVNFLGAVKVIKRYIPSIRNKGAIVLFSSIAASKGFAFHASTAASKAAVEGFVRSLAQEIAPKLRINAIAPTLTETPLSAFITDDSKKREASVKRHPIGRLALPGDIAELAYFLLSEKASMITGAVIPVSGGI
jgi:3-oxoacyl-[acyl-carrier protein] reductase